MSICLVIDTSTSRTSVALLNDQKVVWSAFHDGATDHGKALTELVEQGLTQESQISRVFVGMGPGPYTGLRVGVSFARAFALARGIDVVGVCSLDAIECHEAEYVVATDARRKEIYWARYKDGKRVEGPSVNLPSEVTSNFFIGEGAVKYGLSSNDGYPKLALFPALATVTEPMYLRRPDAVPTAERVS